MKRVCAALAVGLIACLVAACGGGSGASPVPAPAASTQAKQGTLTIKIVIPSTAGAAQAKTAALKRIYSAASATAGILFTIYPHAGNPATQAIVVSGNDISGDAGSSCTTTGTTRTCTISIAAPAVSTNDLLAQTYDQIIPASGSIPVGAHLLAAGTVADVSVAAGTTNTVNLTLNPVLASVALAPTPLALHAMLAGSANIAVYGYDAGGNLILAGSYVDQNGAPVTVGLGLTTNPNNAGNLTITTASGSGVFTTLTYNGMADAAGAIQISSSAPFPATGSVSLLAPSVNAVSDAGLANNPPATIFEGIASYNGGSENWLFYETPAIGGISYVNAGANGGPGTQIPSSQTPNSEPAPFGGQGGMVFASGFLYTGGSPSTTQYSYTVGSPPPLPVPQVAATCTPLATGACATTSGIAYDGSNTLYYGSANFLTTYTAGSSALSTCTVTTPTGSPVFAGFAWDSSNSRLWFADNQSGGSVYDYDLTSCHQSPGLATAPWAVALDASGNAYFTQPSAHHIVRYTSNAASGSNLTITTVEAPEYIASSPNSNTLWFSESISGGGVKLGRMDLTTGALSEMTIAATGSAGPILILPYVDIAAVVQYSGTASPGALLLVQP